MMAWINSHDMLPPQNGFVYAKDGDKQFMTCFTCTQKHHAHRHSRWDKVVLDFRVIDEDIKVPYWMPLDDTYNIEEITKCMLKKTSDMNRCIERGHHSAVMRCKDCGLNLQTFDWISIHDKTPMPEVAVLATDGTDCSVAFYAYDCDRCLYKWYMQDSRFYCDNEYIGVTHWMPLPVLPK